MTENRKLEITIGEKAPDFSLSTNENLRWRLSDQIGNVVALLFYPQNETLVCTKQLCSIRDYWNEYVETGATVIAVSPGTIEENDNFINNHQLPIKILADRNRRITDQFCYHWLFPTFLTRSIVIVDAKGLIRSQKIILRAFRPTDRSVITSIYSAKANLLTEKYKKLAKKKKFKL